MLIIVKWSMLRVHGVNFFANNLEIIFCSAAAKSVRIKLKFSFMCELAAHKFIFKTRWVDEEKINSLIVNILTLC